MEMADPIRPRWDPLFNDVGPSMLLLSQSPGAKKGLRYILHAYIDTDKQDNNNNRPTRPATYCAVAK